MFFVLLVALPAVNRETSAGTSTEVPHLLTQGQPQIQTLPIPIREGDRNPLNEYLEADRIRLMCHPELFLLGEGASRDATLSDREKDHFNRQFTRKFAKDKEFNASEFNKTNRHCASKVVARKIRNNPTAMEAAAVLFNSDEFKQKLKSAVDNRAAKDIDFVLQNVNPFLQGLAAKIPFSGEERANVLSELYAYMQTFGHNSSFLTFSPDDTNDTVMLRLCWGSTSNCNFPATDEIKLLEGSASFKEVNITPDTLPIVLYRYITSFHLYFPAFYCYFFN